MALIAHQSHRQNYEKYRLQPNKTAEIVVEGDKRRLKNVGHRWRRLTLWGFMVM